MSSVQTQLMDMTQQDDRQTRRDAAPRKVWPTLLPPLHRPVLPSRDQHDRISAPVILWLSLNFKRDRKGEGEQRTSEEAGIERERERQRRKDNKNAQRRPHNRHDKTVHRQESMQILERPRDSHRERPHRSGVSTTWRLGPDDEREREGESSICIVCLQPVRNK